MILKQSTASQKIYVKLVDETDGYTAETGIAAPTVKISKNGAAFASADDGTWAELENGVYTVQLNATDTATAGPFSVQVVASGCRTYHFLGYIEPEVDGFTQQGALEKILAMADGKVAVSGNTYTFYEQDNTTPAFTLTWASTGRTRS